MSTERLDVDAYRNRVRHLLAPALRRAFDSSGTGKTLASRQGHRAPLQHLLGAQLSEDVVARVSLPFFDNSQMDGYAVNAADLAELVPGADGREMPVVATIAAGLRPEPLQPGTTAAIMTGAQVPEGATAVVPVEDALPSTFADGIPDSVRFTRPVQPGTFIRSAGSDLQAGTVIATAGQRLTPRLLGVCAALGLGETDVAVESVTSLEATHPRPTVLVISTGDEVVAPGTVPATQLAGSGKIFDANTTLLATTLTDYGCEAVVRRPSDDNPEQFVATLTELVATLKPDFILSSGGVSAGAFEVVKLALQTHGVSFSKVAMQPGGPQGSGLLQLPGHDPLPLLALPGNPVSCWISVEAFVRPVLVEAGLRRATSEHLSPRRTFTAELRLETASEPSPKALLQLRRAHVDEAGHVELVAGPSSHLLTALAHANAIVPVPVGVDHLSNGQQIDGWHLENG
ncbi:molybdopterin molybdotransferase MoeA [Micrococcoides hystricis]|uniref:Molybdopterin molybdenumtransferase n=1 Tax=Micrococcoides hystricis TaxID=1572761 RepID=A0ABV6P8N4_9MICC